MADSSRAGGPKTGDIVDGRYVLIEPLGKGGMGVVWKARSTALDVEVAVKLVRGSTPSAEAFKRMAREAHAAARLGHPAMATVLDFGATSEGDPYVVMELLRGESLGEVLGREGRVDVLRAVGTLLPIMDGLREAHDKGIVHRDIKPENLFISKAERGRLQPKVLDFGIAKLEQQTDSNTKLTQDGAVLGSPGYFSPEQARGQTDLDYRTDIWSISVVLYELITGELPFTGPNYNALLMSILKDTPASLMSHGFGDDELWQIVEKGLHRDRDERWSSMWELGQALARWLYNQGVRTDVASRSLKEVWLDSRTGSEHAGPKDGFVAGGGRRHVLSTLVKRRGADTLAGETMSTLARQRLSPKALGWSAAALGLGALVLGLVMRGDDAQPSLAAGPEAGQSLASVEQAAPAEAANDDSTSAKAGAAAISSEPERASSDPESAPPGAAEPATTAPAARRVSDALKQASKSTARATATRSAPSVTPKRAKTIRAKKTATSRAATHKTKSPPRRSAPARRSTPRKQAVDLEFGF